MDSLGAVPGTYEVSYNAKQSKNQDLGVSHYGIQNWVDTFYQHLSVHWFIVPKMVIITPVLKVNSSVVGKSSDSAAISITEKPIRKLIILPAVRSGVSKKEEEEKTYWISAHSVSTRCPVH